ncbi:hypothetical protein [Streptomyces phaeochromogenes]|uniref:hypothetical protein n=1 Tax=Streptomyces phaeochromogenes TaxID=1923 RepID=UPI0034016577
MAEKLINSKGRITFLRVERVGSRFGPPGDSIDVEAVIRISSHPDRAMGFQLRADAHQIANTAMLDLLRDAFAVDLPVSIDYSIDLDGGKKNGTILRVTLER